MSASLELLTPSDMANLRSSGLTDETIAAMGCRSASAEIIRVATGVISVASGGYSIPYPGVVDQTGSPYCRWRLSEPGKDGQRYVGSKGDDVQLYIPPGFADLPFRDDLLVITEGEKKACKAAQEGIACVGVQGVYSWASPGERAVEKAKGEGFSKDTLPLAALLNLASRYKRVLVLGDSDLLDKPQPRLGLAWLAEALGERGVRAAFACCPPALEGEGAAMHIVKQGLDDWLVASRSQARSSFMALFRFGEMAEGPMSDTYHGREIALLFKGRLCYSRAVWWYWQAEVIIWTVTNGRMLAGEVGKRYEDDAKHLARIAGRVKHILGPRTDNDPLMIKLGGWIERLENEVETLRRARLWIESVRGWDAATKMAEHLLRKGDDEWDSVDHLLAVQNGIVDLRTSELLPPSPLHLVTRIASVAYDPAAQCPIFHKFLDRIQPGPQRHEFLQRLAGYSAVGTAREQKLYTLVGSGRNGKGTFVEAIRGPLGTYAAKANSDMLAPHPVGAARNDLAANAGVRMLSMSESSEHFKLDENFLKSVTGGDALTCRYFFKEFFTFKPRFTIWLDTNHALRPRETGVAMQRRMAVLTFDEKISDEECDKELDIKLRAEYPGILAYIVEGARLYLADGLVENPGIIAATEALWAECDEVGQWIEQHNAILNKDARAQATPLYQNFTAWCNQEGNLFPMGMKNFRKRLLEKGFTLGKSNGVMVYSGLRLREKDEIIEAESEPEIPTSVVQIPASPQPLKKDPQATELLYMPGGIEAI